MVALPTAASPAPKLGLCEDAVASCKFGACSERDILGYVARDYKARAHDEELLQGESQKSRGRPPKK
jgi:hypothetical protein